MTRSLWLSTRSVRQKLSRQRITSWEQRPPSLVLPQPREPPVPQQLLREPQVRLVLPRVRQARRDQPGARHRGVELEPAVEAVRQHRLAQT